MTTIAARLSGLLLAAACSHCSSSQGPSSVENATLQSGVVAMVGSEPVSSAFVASVANRHQLSKAQARDLVVADALFAEAARARFGDSGVVQVAQRSAHSRALLDLLQTQAKQQGAVSDQELEQLKNARWMDLDRPPSVATVHAVVQGGPGDEQSRLLAEQIAHATAGAKTAKQFIKRAKKVKSKAIKVRIERLPFITPDGRAVYLDATDPRRQRPTKYDLTFAKAANAIAEPGLQSGVVLTSFGYHVIMLLERAAPQRYTLAELRAMLSDDVYKDRAGRRLQELNAHLREVNRVELAPNWKELTALVSKRP